MTDNPQRLWLQDSLNRAAITRAAEAIQRTGRALPCVVTAVNGSIVTVAFDLASPWTIPPITLPKAEGQWIRSPTQVGDTGMTVPADAYLGGISGLGGGTADATQRANLAALVWVPVAAKPFSGVNVNAAYVSGPEGAVIQDTDGNSIAVISNAGTITLSAKAKIVLSAPEIELDGLITQTDSLGAGGTVTLIGPVNVVNDVTAEGTSLHTHLHSGVQPGGGDTGPPV